MEQRTQEWREIRRGRFTASEIHKLIGTGVKPSKFGEKLSDWTDTAQNYILSKVAEYFSEQDQEITSREMQWGTDHEPEARAYYEGVFKEQVEEVGFILWPANPLCGCSPDGIVISKNRGIEIKCPFTLNAHIESFLIKDNTTFKSYKPQYYWQVMSSLLFTGFDSWDFVSYHPFFKPDKRLTSIEILPCIADFEMLKERLQAATIVRENLIREIEL